MLPASRFRHRCEQLASTPVYDGLHSYCQLPITTARSHLGGVEFISREANAFLMENLAKLTQLAAIVAIALENVLDKERTLEQANSCALSATAARSWWT